MDKMESAAPCPPRPPRPPPTILAVLVSCGTASRPHGSPAPCSSSSSSCSPCVRVKWPGFIRAAGRADPGKKQAQLL
jgi:hypothetical protein